MRRYFCLIIMLAISFFTAPSYSEEEMRKPVTAPLSPRFLEWQAKQLNSGKRSADASPASSPLVSNNALTGEDYSGYVPFPVDLSYLADNPPDENFGLFAPNYKASASDTKYDLRSSNLVTSVKDQNPYETCWAHATIGAMESNALKNALGTVDLSEMHAAYFSFINSTKSKAFYNMSSFTAAMGHGGNAFYPTALYSRLDGPVLESDVPYGANREPNSKTPDSYQRALRLKDVYLLTFVGGDGQRVNDNRASVKQRIVDNGGVMASYYHLDSGYQTTTDGGTSYYNSSETTNHAVLIVGWDDNYSRTNFKSRPNMDGAWLCKNSWGTGWGTGGYFWMSYASYLVEGTAFVVEKNNPDLKAYYYDALGWCTSMGWPGSDNYAANVFKAERSGERLIEVGLYAPANNKSYEISIYTDLGSSMPSSPVKAPAAATKTVSIAYAGYHTITLDAPVPLTQNQYFSVVVKYKDQEMMPVEKKVSGFSDNASIEAGSFFSYNGTSWQTGSQFSSSNATIKAFTTTAASDTAPDIKTTSLTVAALDVEYSAMLSAFGQVPMTWSVTAGSLPDGLTLNPNTGVISGIPTTKGEYTFTVEARNTKGADTQELTITVTDLPVIVTSAFTAYKGNSFEGQLQLNISMPAEWSAEGLPGGLKLDSESGLISGKPKKTGEFSVTVTATTSAGTTLPVTVIITVNDAPTKPSIKTSKLTQITIGDSVTDKLQYSGTEPITFEAIEGMPDGLYLDSSTGQFSGTPTEAGNFTIKVTARNIYNDLKDKDPTVKKIKLVVMAVAPKIDVPEILGPARVNEPYSTTITLSEGTAQATTWKASGLPKGMVLSCDSSYNWYIIGTPTKAGNFNVKLTAKNNAGTDKTDKIPFPVYAVPEITTKALKNATTDKAYSVKLAAKNSPTQWTVSGLYGTGLTQSSDAKGNVLIAGTPTVPGEYAITVTASNEAGSATKEFTLTINGVKPKIKASLQKGKTGTAYEGTITVTGTKPLEISYSIAEADRTKHGFNSLEELGLTFTANSSTGIATITGTPPYSVKGLPLTISATNAATGDSPVVKKVKLTIAGDKPVFTAPADSKPTISPAAGTTVAVNLEVTGSPKMTWSMKGAAGFTLTPDTENPLKATLTGSAPSKKVSITVTAQNADGKAAKKITINAASTASNTTALPENYGEARPDAIKFGEPRTAGALTDAERRVIETEGYAIAAVLPEISVNVSGMYDLEAELDGKAETGAKLVWLAFAEPKSEDDGIAEFFDEDGAEIEGVPESHKVTVSVWLNEGTTYRPVIAVKQ
ncbi:MAG: putative Ig domain-containing protein [Synergistaceae bacterium]|nr:putative Ig domain-containing protein [Synergistaceae bacterium]